MYGVGLHFWKKKQLETSDNIHNFAKRREICGNLLWTLAKNEIKATKSQKKVERLRFFQTLESLASHQSQSFPQSQTFLSLLIDSDESDG